MDESEYDMWQKWYIRCESGKVMSNSIFKCDWEKVNACAKKIEWLLLTGIEVEVRLASKI